jgi:hypothetical protein
MSSNLFVNQGVNSPIRTFTALLLIIESFILLLPLVILGNSIGWPASLSEPAVVNLPLVIDQYPNVMIGYSIYLVYSILFWPVAFLSGKILSDNEPTKTLFKLANGFALLSVLTRCLGIVRWMFTMPLLAQLHESDDTPGTTKATIRVIYDMLNSYAGGIGETLGVSLFAAIWLVLVSVIIIRNEHWPKPLSYFGFITAVLLALNLLSTIDIEIGAMSTISVVFLQFWMLSAGVIFLRKRSAG